MSGCEHGIDVAIQSRQSNVRNARYGYRGVRVGEANHPGLSHSSAPDGVLDSLELTLQRIDSDTDDGMASLDAVNLKTVFERRACVMRSAPHFLRGALRASFRVALNEIVRGCEASDRTRQIRGWKLFMLLPKMLFHRPPRGGLVPRGRLEDRFRRFAEGQWVDLVNESMMDADKATVTTNRRRRRDDQNELDKRATRALRLVHFGELSSARQALEGANVAPGTLRTLAALTDPTRRPPEARERLSNITLETHPANPFNLDHAKFPMNLRFSRRGAAGGPSGMTADRSFPILASDRDSSLLAECASVMDRGDVPEEVLEWARMERITALAKPDGGVRGIVAGDILRRLVARTMAQQVSKNATASNTLFPHGQGECVAHVVQALTDLNPEATVVSIDGIGT